MAKLKEERELAFANEYAHDMVALRRFDPTICLKRADAIASKLLKRRVAVDIFRRIVAEDPNTWRDGLKQRPAKNRNGKFMNGYTHVRRRAGRGLPANFYSLAQPVLGPVRRIARAEDYFAKAAADILWGAKIDSGRLLR